MRRFSSRLSVKTRLYLMSGFLLSSLVLIFGLSYYGLNMVSQDLHNVSDVQLPAIRYMTLVDMMHDGIRASVYQSIIVSSKELGVVDENVKKSAETEFSEMSANLEKYLGEIAKLPLHSETKAAIEGIRPKLKQYQQSGHKIVQAAVMGDQATAIGQIPQFQKDFEILEASLEHLGEIIESDASQIRDSSNLAITNLIFVGLFLALAGALFSSRIMRELVSELTLTIQQLSAASHKLKDATTEVEANSTQLSASSSEEAAALQQTAATINQISMTVEQSTSSAERARDASQNCEEIAVRGNERAILLVEKMDKIMEGNRKSFTEFEASSKRFDEIVKIIDKIGEKTAVINDIVFQTKLLSFNASVEAARAGEHGRGFAVVAEEVGTLARSSGTAAAEIRSLLSNSATTVNTIAKEMKDQVFTLVADVDSRVKDGAEQANLCVDDLKLILENAKDSRESSVQIFESLTEQVKGIIEVNRAVQELNDVATKNADMSIRSADTATTLTHQNKLLLDVVEKMKTLAGHYPALSNEVLTSEVFEVEKKKKKPTVKRAA